MKNSKFYFSEYKKKDDTEDLKAPEGYYHELENNVRNKITSSTKQSFINSLIPIVSIASVIIFVFVFINKKYDSDTKNSNTDWLSYIDEDIEEQNYISITDELTEEELNAIYEDFISAN